jgi:dTDP-glucose 4,6-dehydratase
VHFAAESHVDRSITGPEAFVSTNVLGTQILLECFRQYLEESPNPDALFLHVSTDEVYGSLTKKEPSFTERSTIKPNSPYSASKAGSDFLVYSYYKTFGLPVKITRCSNNYGPFQLPEKLIPLTITNALADKSIPVYGDGSNIRDWIYVRDHVLAILDVMRLGDDGGVYNIGALEEWTNIDIVTYILDYLNKRDLITFVEDRKGHDFRYAMDIKKLTHHTGWTPLVSFEEGLRRTIEWYIENENWWRPLLKKAKLEN